MSDIKYHYLNVEDAVALIKKSYRPGVRHYVSGDVFLYSKTPDQCELGENPRGYTNSFLIKVSQRHALAFVPKVLSKVFEGKGAKIKVGVSDGAIYVG